MTTAIVAKIYSKAQVIKQSNQIPSTKLSKLPENYLCKTKLQQSTANITKPILALRTILRLKLLLQNTHDLTQQPSCIPTH
jgi:hypothetical protein